MTKNIQQMRKPELLAIYDEFQLLLPDVDNPTNAELREMLQVDYGITDAKLLEFRSKKDAELLAENGKQPYADNFLEDEDGNVVIVMDRKNPSYQIGNYKFTQTNRYLPVDADTAEKLLSKTGFRKATREEIKRNFS